MSEEDKMLEKLNYHFMHCDDRFFYHNPNSDCTIHFDIVKKRITCYDYDSCLANAIELEELQAINMKCKELRWLE